MIVTRFAPSPTGRLHVGNLRTAVLNWLVARQNNGQFILRIDDTDTERSKTEHADAIRRDLEWLGLHWDREERQSERMALYHDAMERLRSAGRVYECFETPLELDLKRRSQLAAGKPPVYDRSALMLTNAEKTALREKRNPHLRFLLEGEAIIFDDMIRGEQRIDPGSLSDPVLMRADGQLLYTLASVVDDADMGITHVVRGADHVTNTGTQIQIFTALGATSPVFAHHSLLTGADGEALSKRLGTLSLGDLREAGAEPMALVAMMARLGSSLPVEVITDRQVLIETFDIRHFGLSPTKFDPEDLWLQSAKTLRAMPYETVASRLMDCGIPADLGPAFWAAVGPNLDRFSDAADWWNICQQGAVPLIAETDADFVAQAMDLLPARPWDETSWAAWTQTVRDATGRKGKALFQPLRKALTGRGHGPDMSRLMPLLQKLS